MYERCDMLSHAAVASMACYMPPCGKSALTIKLGRRATRAVPSVRPVVVGHQENGMDYHICYEWFAVGNILRLNTHSIFKSERTYRTVNYIRPHTTSVSHNSRSIAALSMIKISFRETTTLE